MQATRVTAMLLVACACSQERTPGPASSARANAGFVDRVWTVVESAGGPGDLYVFLSDGTFIRTSKGAVPSVGKWSWDGTRTTYVESVLPYQAEIDSLTESYFRFTIHFMDQSWELGLVPATASMPDTTQTVEFDPAQASIIAMGKNPTWLFTVDNDQAMLRMSRRTIKYTNGEWVQDCASVWDYTAQADGEEISLELSTATCLDTTSGAASPLTAVLIRGEQTLWGCAVAGKLR